MRAGFGVHGDVVAARLGEGLEIGIAGRDHQMRVEDLPGVGPQRLDDVGTVGNVRHEMAVHHVEVNPVGACRVDGANLLAKPGKIRRQDRWRDDERAGREGLGHERFFRKGRLLGRADGNRLTRTRAVGNGSGKFCRRGSYCRVRDGHQAARRPDFIGFFALARRLLTWRAQVTLESRAIAAWSEFSSCYLPLVPFRPHWTPCSRSPRSRLPANPRAPGRPRRTRLIWLATPRRREPCSRVPSAPAAARRFRPRP